MLRSTKAAAATGALALLATAVAAPSAARAGTTLLRSDLTALNNSGVNATAEMVYDDVAETLTVHIMASGLEPNQLHPQHIHGFVDGTTNARTPTLEQDSDGDGFLELAEGLPKYGPILLELAPFQSAADGTIDYERTFTNADIDGLSPIDGFDSVEDLSPLHLREIVIHGLSVRDAGAGTGGEVDGTPGYKLVLPVASGEINGVAVIPLPPGAWAGLSTMAGMGGLSWLRGRFRRRGPAA